MNTTWILVASREEARLFSRRGKGFLKLERDIGNPLGRLKSHDLVSDKAGASNDNRKPGRHAYSTQESPRDRALKDFYREVIAQVEHALETQAFDNLVLIAEPRLLGLIRDLLPNQLRRRVSEEISKDLSFEKPEQLAQRL